MIKKEVFYDDWSSISDEHKNNFATIEKVMNIQIYEDDGSKLTLQRLWNNEDCLILH